MNIAHMLAQAEQLDRQAETILTEDTAAYFARRMAAGEQPMPAGWRLRSSERSKAIQAEAARLRQQAEHLTIAPAADFRLAPAASLPPAATGQSSAPAASSLPPEIVARVDAAVSAALLTEVRTETAAPLMTRAPQPMKELSPEAAYEAAVDATVARILAAGEADKPLADAEAEARAQQILATGDHDEDDDELEAVVRRIEAA